MDVAGILGSGQQGPHDRQCLGRGQSARRAGELAADLDIRLDRCAPGQRRREGRRDARPIADEPRRPEPDVRDRHGRAPSGRSAHPARRPGSAPRATRGRAGRRPPPSASRRFSAGATAASLRSPIRRRAVCRVHLLGSASRSTSWVESRAARSSDFCGGGSPSPSADRSARWPGRSGPRGCGSG